MSRQIRIVLLVALILLGAWGIFTVAQAQTTFSTQQWEYALMTWSVSKHEFTFTASSLYPEKQFALVGTRDLTEQMWASVGNTEGAGPVDYLAVMGISGYELVDVTYVQDTFVYTFKRPAKAA